MSRSLDLEGLGDIDRDRFVDMVDTDENDELDRDRFPGRSISSGSALRLRPRSSSRWASCSSAMPALQHHFSIFPLPWAVSTYLRSRVFGTSLVSLGISFGFASCWVLEGREAYGRSCALALHS